MLGVDGRGRLAWRSPQAQRWLAEFFADGLEPTQAATPATAQADGCARWLDGADSGASALRAAEGSAAALRHRSAADGRTLVARRLGDIGMGEAMWPLSLQRPGDAAASRLATAAHTPRETEVLW